MSRAESHSKQNGRGS